MLAAHFDDAVGERSMFPYFEQTNDSKDTD